VRLPRSGRSAAKERARPGGLRHELIDESPRPRERARLLGAVRPVGLERPRDELEWQAQPGEQRHAARVGSAGTTANDRIAALVARKDATAATAAGARARVRTGLGHGAAVLHAKHGAIAAARGADLREWRGTRSVHGAPREERRAVARRGPRSRRRG